MCRISVRRRGGLGPSRKTLLISLGEDPKLCWATTLYYRVTKSAHTGVGCLGAQNHQKPVTRRRLSLVGLGLKFIFSNVSCHSLPSASHRVRRLRSGLLPAVAACCCRSVGCCGLLAAAGCCCRRQEQPAPQPPNTVSAVQPHRKRREISLHGASHLFFARKTYCSIQTRTPRLLLRTNEWVKWTARHVQGCSAPSLTQILYVANN